VRVTYYSAKEIGLAAVTGGSGKLWVGGVWIDADRSLSVWNNLAVINFDSQTNALTFDYVDPGEEYWIYVANSDASYQTLGLPGDNTHNPAPVWDYRNKMFLSLTPNVNGYLSDIGCGRNARLI